MYVLLTPLTCMGITALSYFEPLSTPPTQLSNFLWIENPLNIKKVMSKDV